jgi:hypothetical protein
MAIDAAAIAQARDADILDTAVRCGAQLKRATASEHAGPCPACGGTDRFSVNVRKRIFNCRGFGGGDVIAMAQHALGVDFVSAVDFLTGTEARPAANAAHVQHSRGASTSDPQTEASVARIAAGLSPIRGSIGEAYLKEKRGIDTEAIADVLARVEAIGWHPSVYFNEEGHALHGRRLGCIVGTMTDAVTARPTGAISRTCLDANGRKVGKAKTLGSPAGIVRLSDDADVLGGLFVAEGLETALSAMAIGLRPIWSTGSTALMSSFPLLSGIECLTLIADHDANGAGERAALEAKARWLGAGREVRVLRRGKVGDLNDAVREAVA